MNRYVEEREHKVVLEALERHNQRPLINQDEVFGLIEHAKNDPFGTLGRIDQALINLSKVRSELLRSRDTYLRRLVHRAVKDKVR